MIDQIEVPFQVVIKLNFKFRLREHTHKLPETGCVGYRKYQVLCCGEVLNLRF